MPSSPPTLPTSQTVPAFSRILPVSSQTAYEDLDPASAQEPHDFQVQESIRIARLAQDAIVARRYQEASNTVTAINNSLLTELDPALEQAIENSLEDTGGRNHPAGCQMLRTC